MCLDSGRIFRIILLLCRYIFIMFENEGLGNLRIIVVRVVVFRFFFPRNLIFQDIEIVVNFCCNFVFLFFRSPKVI